MRRALTGGLRAYEYSQDITAVARIYLYSSIADLNGFGLCFILRVELFYSIGCGIELPRAGRREFLAHGLGGHLAEHAGSNFHLYTAQRYFNSVRFFTGSKL